jgi:sulfite exporter TauE/SafE
MRHHIILKNPLDYNMWIALSTGLWLGLGSAAHCLGMCGPIAMVLPFKNSNGTFKWFAMTLYHLGRMLTYIILGLIIGLIGSLFRWQGIGAWISLVMGIVLLVYAIHYAGFIPINQKFRWRISTNWIRNIWSKVMSKGNQAWFFPAGLANGLLPCGMVYAAAIVALGMRSMGETIGVMSGFAIGTLPVFILLPFAVKLFRRGNQYRYFIPILLFITSVWLILRGLLAFTSTSDSIHSIPMCIGDTMTVF